MKKIMVTPINIVRYLRVRQGLSQEKLAQRCGVKTLDVSRIERGEKRINHEKFLSLAAFFGTSVDDLAFDRFHGVLQTIDSPPKRNPERQRQREARQRKRDRIGREGEGYVARLEREKLRGTLYQKGVNEAFADDITAGFDIMSFDTDGTKIYIEVKTTSGGMNEPFFLTAREKEVMENCFYNGLRYEIHRVYHMAKKKHPCRVIYTAEEMMGFIYEPATYVVKKGA